MMGTTFYLQHGLCKRCGRESLVIAREPESDQYEGGNSSMCPYCGNENEFDIKESFGEASYFLDEEELNSLSGLIGIQTCDKCRKAIVLTGYKSTVMELEFRFKTGPVESTAYEFIYFCNDCLENSSQKELIHVCENVISSRPPSCSVNDIYPDRSPEAIAEAFKSRKIL